MKTLKKLKPTKRVWTPNFVETPWTENGFCDNGQKTAIYMSDSDDNEVLLTMNDLHFMPTQAMLATHTFYAPANVYDKLFKAYYNFRELRGDKVVGNKCKLIKLG